MINCIAIDDEPRALTVIQSLVSRLDFLNLHETFTDPFKAMACLNDHAIDLIFLDINMPNLSGLEFLKTLRKRPLVIFTTAHSEYAMQSYEVDAVDYLLKPFDFARFLLAVNKAQEKLTYKDIKTPDFMFVNTGNQKQRVVLDEIYYLSGEGNYVSYVTKNGKLLVRSSIRDTLKLLPADRFVQIHRSYVVALPWVEKIEDNQVHVADTKITIGATYKDGFLTMIDSFKG